MATGVRHVPLSRAERAVVEAARRWYAAVTLDERSIASLKLTLACKDLSDSEARAKRLAAARQ